MTFVQVGDGASMPLPDPNVEWIMRHSTIANVYRDRMVAATIMAAYSYLIQECTKEESWRRIKIIRAAMNKQKGANA